MNRKHCRLDTKSMFRAAVLLFCALFAVIGCAQTQPVAPSMSWVALGTQGGPVLAGGRAEPANLLVVDGKPWIVDCGDGAMEHLVAAGFAPKDVNVAVISHLHMDHIGGLQALIGLRWMQNARAPLTVYGPPGTDSVVAGLIQAMQAPARIWRDDSPDGPTPEASVKVVVIKDGADVQVQGVRMRAVQNTHFALPKGGFSDNGSQSLSLRFDYGKQAIGYSGDTGPSDAVTALMKGVNVLICEVIDLPVMTNVINNLKFLTAEKKTAMIEHFKIHHITPQDAGKMAAVDGVERLIFTHLSVPSGTTEGAPSLIKQAHETFKGEVIVARELDRF